MGNCDYDFVHRDDNSFFENHHRALVWDSFCKTLLMLLISSIDQHLTFLIYDNKLGIVTIEIFIIKKFNGKG